MSLGKLTLSGALVAALALGVVVGRVSGSMSGKPRALNTDEATLRKLASIEQQVRELGAKEPAVVQLVPSGIGAAAGPAPAPVASRSPARGALPETEEAPAGPTEEQIAAGDRLVALAETLVAKGRLTADDRRELRQALAASDPERREATILTLVRAMNEQRLRPTEPGSPF